MERDKIDLGKMNVVKLFGKILFPTLLGMVFSAVITITDGIFVGRGVGSDSLAAINIVAPLFMITAGIGLMFGVGGSVIASIHLSRQKVKAANIIVTQAMLVSSLMMVTLSALIMLFPSFSAFLLGSSERLFPLVMVYMQCIVPFLVFNMLLNVGLFFIRLDGSPNFAMACSVLPALLNVVLDYLFIFPFGWGLAGAAWASVISVVVGGIMIFIYWGRYATVLSLYRLKATYKSFRLTMRNVNYMIRIGSSALLGEGAIACMILVGNYIFMRYLGEDGVAAFSVACYCFPIVFMINNAIAQSAQPIISFNYGLKNEQRVSQAFRLSVITAIFCGIIAALGMSSLSNFIVSLFMDKQSAAHAIAVAGLPYFSIGFLFFALNIVSVGFFQSVERSKESVIYTLLRGFIVVILAFIFLPQLIGVKGIWLAVPTAEIVTFVCILLFGLWKTKIHPVPDTGSQKSR